MLSNVIGIAVLIVSVGMFGAIHKIEEGKKVSLFYFLF